MKCNRTREVLSSSFSASAQESTSSAQQHLRHCEECRSYMRQERELRELLRKLTAEKPSARFKEKLFADISRLRWEQVREKRKKWIHRLASVAAVLIVVAVGWLWLAQEPAPPSRLLDYMITDHRQNLPGRFMMASSSPSELEAWFAGKVDFPFQVHVPVGGEILGARLCHIEDQRATLVFFRCRSHILSWFTFPATDIEGVGRSPSSYSADGYNLVIWKENGLINAVVSDMDSGELLKISSP